MKNGKAPTRKEKLIMQSVGLNADHWLVFKKTHETLELVLRETGTTKTVYI
jgi:hypothetical protein